MEICRSGPADRQFREACTPVYTVGHIVFALSVGLFVGLFASNFNICHNFCNIEDSNLIFGMHGYLMELHNLSGERYRSSFKVKGQKTKSREVISFKKGDNF